MIEPTDEMKAAFRAAQSQRAEELVAEGALLGAHAPDILDRGLAAVLAIVERDHAAELTELRAQLQLQWKRTTEATARWRAEDPQARALVIPDLGALLQWLMDDADRACARADPVRGREWPSGRGGKHPHFCLSCSDGETQGPGCINCRSSGFDQTPWPNCQECRPGPPG